MSDILKDFFENFINIKNNKISKKLNGFISCKNIYPEIGMYKLSLKQLNGFKKNYDKDNSINSERKEKINNLKYKNDIINKLVSLSNINILNKNNKNDFDDNNNNIVHLKKDYINKSNVNRSSNRINNTPNNGIKQSNLIHSHSTKNLISLNNINKQIIQNKVNNIVDNLLLEKKKYNYVKSSPQTSFYINKSINPRKYIDFNLKIEPNNIKNYTSFNKQIKAIGSKKLRSYLIEGINNYSLNLKKYNKLNFDYFSIYNYDNKINKMNNKEIKNIIIGNKNKKNIHFGKNNRNKNKMKKSYSLYDFEINKFKLDYINAYNDKKFNFSKNKKYSIRNKYFYLFNNKSFYKILSIDQKFKNIFSSLQKTSKIIGKNTSNIIHNRDINNKL